MKPTIADKVRDFFASYQQNTYSKDHIIIQAGSPPAGVFYIVEGQVRQYDITTGGNEVIVNIFKPGAFFPMSWAINSSPNRYFYETDSKTTIHLAPQEDVIDFLHSNPDITFDLLSRVYRGTDGVLRRLAHLMGGTAESRLIFELINTAHRFGKTGSAGIMLPVNESELAKRSGLARETVSRMLGGLKAKGLIVIVNRNIVIPNLRDLEIALGDDL